MHPFLSRGAAVRCCYSSHSWRVAVLHRNMALMAHKAKQSQTNLEWKQHSSAFTHIFQILCSFRITQAQSVLTKLNIPSGAHQKTRCQFTLWLQELSDLLLLLWGFPLQSSKTENKGFLPLILGEIKISLLLFFYLLSYY